MKLNEIIKHHPPTPSRYRVARDQLIAQYPELKVGGGIGLCAFASAKLKQLLADQVDLEIIIGRKLNDVSTTDRMWNIAKQQWGTIPKDDVRYETAKYLLSHNKKKKDIGHAVCYDGYTIIDITSGQFGLPMFYTLNTFEKTWITIKRDVSIEINDISDFGSV